MPKKKPTVIVGNYRDEEKQHPSWGDYGMRRHPHPVREPVVREIDTMRKVERVSGTPLPDPKTPFRKRGG